jgi:hypothetical protein
MDKSPTGWDELRLVQQRLDQLVAARLIGRFDDQDLALFDELCSLEHETLIGLNAMRTASDRAALPVGA